MGIGSQLNQFEQGEGLGKLVGFTDDHGQRLRARAVECLEASRWRDAIELIEALWDLGQLHPADPLIMARAYSGLGLPEAARHFVAEAHRVHQTFEIPISDAMIEEVLR